MAVIAVVNLKGGVGKSTIAVNLACELAGRKRQVVLVDADEQGTATEWAQAGRLPIRCDAMPLRSEREVQSWLRRVLALNEDAVVIDCPPRLAAVTEAAVGVADLALIPVGASGADLAATSAALALVAQARLARSDSGPACLLIPSRVDKRTASGREIETVLAGLGEPVGPTVHQRAAMVDAFSSGQWIGDYASGSGAHDDVRALAQRVTRVLKNNNR